MDWVAELGCQHNPPWQNRPGVLSEQGRQARLGTALLCKECSEATDGKQLVLNDNNKESLSGEVLTIDESSC